MQRLSIAALGVIALAVGALFTLQGLDVIGGSAMSGHSVWAVVGIVLILVGVGVVGLAAQQGRQRRP